ncbi:uncharacterized protein TRIADDRAFT_56385 [Trichoplax adhaerens]|uniref:Uncharacterized protein n=1 Tax=Trichoplax adhaerens TaxID=10228 RepID=B3RXZ6_TRIAD|nr:hypothetical protein TRIADDRAFT_56385 [Trichoplax adhaerens]EDV24946.1 hypothetical protein TRIADDRAFT_56385 [Trichoplax adhaerens]|eukprot:XP_002112836.1 hypothetical protein TRIADDRAFT_56385 [Trichoplax adhaerens]
MPVLMWSSDKSIVTDDNVFAGEILDVQEAQKRLLPIFSGKPRTVCFFVQNRLSLNDVTRFGHVYGYEQTRSSFHHLKLAIQNAKSSLILPSVMNADVLKEFLKKAASGKVLELTAKEAKKFKFNDHHFDNDAINAIIVHLPRVPVRQA